MKKIKISTPKYHEFAVQSVKDDVAKMKNPKLTDKNELTLEELKELRELCANAHSGTLNITPEVCQNYPFLDITVNGEADGHDDASMELAEKSTAVIPVLLDMLDRRDEDYERLLDMFMDAMDFVPIEPRHPNDRPMAESLHKFMKKLDY